MKEVASSVGPVLLAGDKQVLYVFIRNRSAQSPAHCLAVEGDFPLPVLLLKLQCILLVNLLECWCF